MQKTCLRIKGIIFKKVEWNSITFWRIFDSRSCHSPKCLITYLGTGMPKIPKLAPTPNSKSEHISSAWVILFIYFLKEGNPRSYINDCIDNWPNYQGLTGLNVDFGRFWLHLNTLWTKAPDTGERWGSKKQQPWHKDCYTVAWFKNSPGPAGGARCHGVWFRPPLHAQIHGSRALL